jgi:phage-related protein
MNRKEPLQAIFFETENGNQPVRDFLLERTKEDKKEIGSDIFTVQKRFPLGLPQETMVLLHCFVKKSQKIPSREMKTAKERLAEFRRLRK